MTLYIAAYVRMCVHHLTVNPISDTSRSVTCICMSLLHFMKLLELFEGHYQISIRSYVRLYNVMFN